MKMHKFWFSTILSVLALGLFSFAQQGGGGGGSNGIPGPTGAAQCFVSTASGIGNWTWGACSGSSNLAFNTITSGTNTTATMTVGSGGTLTIASGAVINFGALGTGTFHLPTAAGATSSATKDLIYDSTAANWHIWSNAVDSLLALFPVSTTITNADCAAWSNVASLITLSDVPCAQTIASASHNFLTSYTSTTGAFTKAQPTLADIAAGSAPTGTFDFSGVTMLKGRVGAGLTTTVNGDFGYDTTNKNWHVWDNGTDSFVGVFASAPTTGDVVSATVAASVITLSDTSILATNIIRKDTTNAGAAAMTLDLSASTAANAFKIPSQAGLTSNGTSSVAYDTTAANLHVPANGADAINLAIPAAPVTAHLIDSLVAAGNVLAHDSGIATANVITNVAGLTTNGVSYGTASKTIGTTSAGAADNIFMANDAGVGSAPAFKAGPGSCSSAANAVTYNTSTHAWGCNTISGSGTVNSGTQYQLAYYATSTTAVSGNPNFTVSAAAGTLTLGQANTAAGSLVLEGGTSGALTIASQATAGTPTWTAGTSSGTPAVTASLPLAITAATGNIACATCVTSAASLTSTALVTGGGSQASQTPSATSTLSAAGALQLAAGGSLGSADTGSPTFTFATSKATFNQPLYLGTTSNQLVAGTTTNLTTLTFPVPSGAVTLTFPITSQYMIGANSDTTTTDVLHATAVAGVGAFSALAVADLPTVTIAKGGTNATSAAAGQVANTTSTTASSWTATPTLGIAGTTAGSLTITNSAAAEGSLVMTGHTSGTVTVSPQAAAGTPTILWPNTSGTVATTATAPVALSATTGVISITGAAGQILAGASPAFTATPTLGVASSSTGTLAFANSGNTGVMTLTPASGAVAATVTIPDVTGTLLSSGTTVTVGQGGTGAATFTIHGVLIGETAAAFNATAAGTTGIPLVGVTGADPAFGTATVPGGGTGATTLTAHGILLGEGTSAIAATAAGTQYQFLISNGASDPGWSSWQLPSTGGSNNQCLLSNGTNGVWGACATGSLTGSLTSTQVAVANGSSSVTSYSGFTSDASGNVTVNTLTSASSGAGLASLGQGTAQTTGTTAVGLTAPTSVTSYNVVFPSAASAGTDAATGNLYLKFATTQNQTGCTASSTILCGYYESAINLASGSGDVTGSLPVANGGTGSATLTAHSVLLGEGTSAVGLVSVGGTGSVLIGTSTSDPSFSPNLILGSTTLGTGTLAMTGGTSGVVTIQPQGTAGTYNFNLPTTAGSSGQPLLSGGGGSSPMIYGHTTDNGTIWAFTEGATFTPTSTSQISLVANNPSSTSVDIMDFDINSIKQAWIGSTNPGEGFFGPSAPNPTIGTSGGNIAVCGSAFTGIASNGGWYCNASNFVDLMSGTTDLGSAVAESAVLTAGQIPKASGTNPQLAASTITDNGADVVTSEPIIGGNTSVLASPATTTSASMVTLSLALPAMPASTLRMGYCDLLWQTSNTAGAVTLGLNNNATVTAFQILEALEYTTTSAVTTVLPPAAATTTTTTNITPSMTAPSANVSYLVHTTFSLRTTTNGATITVFGEISGGYTLSLMANSACGWLP